MTLRLEYRDIAPDAVKALSELNRYSGQCSISPGLRRLTEILISKVNGCHYCIDVHTKQALKLGETPERIEQLARWTNSSLYTQAEEAAFAWAETVTKISDGGSRDSHYKILSRHFSELERVDLTFIAISMNAMNRLAISFGRETVSSQ